MRIRLVQFSNGKYGIQKGLFNKRYLDFRSPTFWWGVNDKYFHLCCTSKEEAEEVFDKYPPSVKVIKSKSV